MKISVTKSSLVVVFWLGACSAMIAQSPLLPAVESKQEISEKVKLADWYGFAKAAYSLSFDDGMISHYKYAAPILDRYGLKATFYIVSETLESDSLVSPKWRYGYWYQFLAMHAKGHELGSHSATHPRLTTFKDGTIKEAGTLQYELTAPLRALKKELSAYRPITFAYPFVDLNKHVEEETSKWYYSSRGLGSGFNPVHPSDWMNLQAHAISYGPGRTLASDLSKISELENWITSNTIAKGGWTIYLAHDVLPFEEAITATDSWHPISSESLEVFSKWLKEKQTTNELWVETVGNVTRYCKERDSASIQLVEETSDKMVLSITDNLPNELFNFPITLEVSVPSSWKKVKVKQKNVKNTVEVLNGKVIVNAIPDGGMVEISGVE